jgi:hypothetical protein
MPGRTIAEIRTMKEGENAEEKGKIGESDRVRETGGGNEVEKQERSVRGGNEWERNGQEGEGEEKLAIISKEVCAKGNFECEKGISK